MGRPGPSPTITPDSILDVFRRRDDQSAPLTASEVADAVGCARRTAHGKLQGLVEAGRLDSKKVGARGRVWWRPRSVPDAGADDDLPFRTLVEAVSEYSIFRLDSAGRVVSWNEGAREMKGYTRQEILGTHISTFYTEAQRADGAPEANLAGAAERGTCEDEGWRVRADGSRFWADVVISALRDDAGNVRGYLKITRDLTERRERERAIRMEHDLLERLLETSPVGIAVLDPTGQITRANARAEELLGLTRSEMEGRAYSEPAWNIHDEDGEPIPVEDHPVTHVMETGEPVLGFVHGITLADGRERWLSSNSAPVLDGDGEFERVVVSLEDITELKNQERELQRQRDELERLDRVNEVIRGIDRAIVSADTQLGVERAVCERIADADPYLFAVIGGFSANYEAFTPRALAGLGESYLDEMLHGEDRPPISEGFGATAARTGDVQVAQQLTDLPFDFWAETAHSHGFQSYASVPLVYGDVVYGVLGVYAERPDAFDEDERQILGELGEMVGHAINALERKRALLADTVLEVEFREDGALADVFTGIDRSADATWRIEQTVPLDDGDALQYYTVSGFDADGVVDALERVSSVQWVRVLERLGTTLQLEVRTTGPTLAGVFAQHGGRTTRTEFGDGTVRVVGELPYGTDVRRLADAVEEVSPDMEFVSRRTYEREQESVTGLRDTLTEHTTDRQETALAVGYHAGFFDWPRKSTGEELAGQMGVAPSTFHKHLRRGERHLLEVLFGDGESSAR